jgi:hypothetical protein
MDHASNHNSFNMLFVLSFFLSFVAVMAHFA